MDGGIIAPDHHQYPANEGTAFFGSPLSLCSYICNELFSQLRSKLSKIMSQPGTVQSRALLSLSRDKLTSAALQESLGPQDTIFFDCSYCEGFMAQPVCLPCGHSLCKTCIDKLSSSSTKVCPFPKCKAPVTLTPSERTPTLFMRDMLKKCFPEWVESCHFRETGNTFANNGDFPTATKWYNKAIETGIKDHRVYGNRSRAHLALDKLEEALADAETACSIRPLWKKGHFRRASVFEKLGKWMEAVSAYLMCVYLSEREDISIIYKVCQLLDEHMSEFTQYERNLVPHGYLTSSEKSVSHSMYSDQPSLTPNIDRIVELSIGAIRSTSFAPLPSVEAVSMSSVDFECSLCTGIVYEPVTVTCGHSFCLSCLRRAFDHSYTCPVCRAVLHEFFQAYSQHSGVVPTDKMLSAIIEFHFPQQYQDKRAQAEAEQIRNIRVGTCESEPIPIFVCTRVLPGIPCPLHVFEPRYRLMIRRCVESGSRRFGMCQGGASNSFSDFGTVLYVNSVEFTPDGRSLVKTIGERRFRVVRRDVIDGYDRAWVEFIFDERVTDKSEIDALRALQREVYSHSLQWLDALPPSVKELMMHKACSPLPPIESLPEVCPNGPMWVWWYAHTAPISEQLKLDMYTCTSLSHRLLKLKHALPVVVSR